MGSYRNFDVRRATLQAMRGYNSTSYGDGFADVYDDWYEDVTDVAATVSRVQSLAGPGGSVLELGVGTGRLAIPLDHTGLTVTGIDSSRTMLDKLAERAPEHSIDLHLGDMVSDLPGGQFDVALIAYNTIFNLLDADDQSSCFQAIAARLHPEGCFIVEAFVPEFDTLGRSDVSVRSMTVDRVVLSVSMNDPSQQLASGQFVEITEAGGVRLRPWSVRWSTPAQLDEMAIAAGLRLDVRFADMAGADFTDDSTTHVSIYRKS